LSTLRDIWDLGTKGLEQEDFQTALRADGDIETGQQSIQDWIELDEGDSGFHLLFLLHILNKDSTAK
jgi:hypothetical protein